MNPHYKNHAYLMLLTAVSKKCAYLSKNLAGLRHAKSCRAAAAAAVDDTITAFDLCD